MATYIFGKALTIPFFATDKDGAAVTSLQASPSIWVYSEQPSRDTVDTEDGTSPNVLGSEITSWSASGNAFDITVPAIADPDNTSQEYVHTYYLGIKYKVASGGADLIQVMGFEITRPFGYDNELNVGAADLLKFFPHVDDYADATAQANFLDEATIQTKAAMRAKQKDYEFYKIRNRDELRTAVVWRTLYLMALALNLQNQEDEGYRLLIEEAKENFGVAVDSLPVELDTDTDGDTDITVQTGNYAIQAT